jgi:hypothetical protein
VQVTKLSRKFGGVALLILNISVRWIWVCRHSLQLLYPLYRGWIGHRAIWKLFGEDKYSCLCLVESTAVSLSQTDLYCYYIKGEGYSISVHGILNLLVVEQLQIFLTFSTRLRWMISFTIQPLYLQRNSPPFYHWRTGVLRSPCRSSDEDKISRYCSQSSS